jgi:tight adherence protein B
MTALQIILIVVIVMVVIGVIVVFVMNREAERKKRLALVIKGQGGVEVKISEKDEQNKRRAEIARKLKNKGDDKGGTDKRINISMLLGRAGLNMSPRQYWIYSAVCMVIVVALAKVMGANVLVLILMAIIGFFGLPRFIVKRITMRRQKKFLTEFPDALESVVRLLRAGMPVAEAVSMIAREFTGPVGEEMSRMYDKQKIGIPLHEAALEATKRMPLTEMQMFATGLSIQAQTGSSLSEVLMNLSGVIRARFKLKRKIKALSSEAIASASIIGALPNLVALGMYFANREYIMVLFDTTIGNFLLAGAVFWMLCGIMVMKIMINFKI